MPIQCSRRIAPILALLVALALPARTFGAINAAVAWEIRTTGADTNGGGFKAGATGTDWTLQDAAQYSVTDGVTAGTTTITSATAAFGTDVVGNVIYVQGGTGSVVAGWYEITVRTNATTITVDRSTGLTAGTGVTLKIGGAIASPGIVGAASAASNPVWIKAGTYACSASNNVASGRVTTGATQRWEGYQTTRGDLGTSPVLQASANSVTIFTAANGVTVYNLTFDGNSGTGKTGAIGFSQSGGAFVYAEGCYAVNCATTGFNEGGDVLFLNGCKATTCTTGYLVGGGNRLNSTMYCVASGCTTGFSAFPGTYDCCIAVNCTTGFVAANSAIIRSCTAYGASGTTGFQASARAGFYGCVSTNNSGAGVGFNVIASTIMDGCAYYNNGTNVLGTPLVNAHAVTLTADPFTNAAGNNFSLNAVSGGGAACRGAAYPATWPGLSTTGYRDIGAVQHADQVGGGFRPRPRPMSIGRPITTPRKKAA